MLDNPIQIEETGKVGYSGLLWAILGYTGLHWATLGYSGLLWATLGSDSELNI